MNGLPKPCYVMSEPHLSGYRVVLGYETLAEAQDAQSALAASPPAREEAPAEVAGGGAWKKFENDFNAMTDAQIEDEVRRSQDALDEAEDWLEAVADWKSAGSPRRAEGEQ